VSNEELTDNIKKKKNNNT